MFLRLRLSLNWGHFNGWYLTSVSVWQFSKLYTIEFSSCGLDRRSWAGTCIHYIYKKYVFECMIQKVIWLIYTEVHLFKCRSDGRLSALNTRLKTYGLPVHPPKQLGCTAFEAHGLRIRRRFQFRLLRRFADDPRGVYRTTRPGRPEGFSVDDSRPVSDPHAQKYSEKLASHPNPTIISLRDEERIIPNLRRHLNIIFGQLRVRCRIVGWGLL